MNWLDHRVLHQHEANAGIWDSDSGMFFAQEAPSIRI